MVIDTAQEYLTKQKANERRNLLSQIRKLNKKELERFPMIVQYA